MCLPEKRRVGWAPPNSISFACQLQILRSTGAPPGFFHEPVCPGMGLYTQREGEINGHNLCRDPGPSGTSARPQRNRKREGEGNAQLHNWT